jgi:hypothetical protein
MLLSLLLQLHQPGSLSKAKSSQKQSRNVPHFDKEMHHSADKSPPIAVFLNQMNPVLDAL